MRSRLAAFALLALASCSFQPSVAEWGMPERYRGRAENASFANLVEAFLAWYWASHPTRATTMGIHDYDAVLPDVSAAAIEGRAGDWARWLGRLHAIDRDQLSDDAFHDWRVLEAAMQAALLDLREIRTWERYPSYYRGLVAGGLHSLAALRFAPPEQRLEAAIGRLAGVPAVLDAAKANLKTPAAIHVDMAVDEFAGTRSLIADALPEAFKDVKSADLTARFADRRKEAVAALDAFIPWLKTDLRARATGSYAIGEGFFAAKLRHEEMVDTPIEPLLADGERLLAETQQAIREIAERISPGKPAREVLDATAADHVAADKLLDETRAMLDGLKAFSREKLCDVPADADCKIRETPAFRRTTSFASMEIPGPFETVATDAYYSITLPDPSWSAERQEQHLRFFNRWALVLISVHEAYPGHYTQFLAVRGLPSRIRRVFGSGSFSEGWAHYLEQVYVDLQDNPDPRLRLHQLHMALLRICRYLVGIRMHCRGMSYEQAVQFFQEQGYLAPVNAEREARRGTADPTYLVYTLGKIQILKLRDEIRARRGAAFDLKEFHNRLIAHGYPPVKVVRAILLGLRE